MHERHPGVPVTLYANGSGGLLERMGATGADVIGLDWTVDMADARRRLGAQQSVQVPTPATMQPCPVPTPLQTSPLLDLCPSGRPARALA